MEKELDPPGLILSSVEKTVTESLSLSVVLCPLFTTSFIKCGAKKQRGLLNEMSIFKFYNKSNFRLLPSLKS